MSASRILAQEDLDRLLIRLAPRIAQVLERYRIAESEVAEMVAEALVGVAYRWNRVRDPDQWVLDSLEKKARSRSAPAPKENKDE